MVRGAPGLDVASMVKATLDEGRPPGPSRRMLGLSKSMDQGGLQEPNAYGRLFASRLGQMAVQRIGNESRTLDALSFLSVEVLLEYMEERWGANRGGPGAGTRFLTVRGDPADPPTLVVLDPALGDVSQSRRITEEIELEPQGLVAAFERLLPYIAEVDHKLAGLQKELHGPWMLELLTIAQPEIVLSRRPRMVWLCAPSPHVVVRRGAALSSAGIFCRDRHGRLGVTACLHGTGPAGTEVTVGGTPAAVEITDAVQDMVFIPLDENYPVPSVRGRAGVRCERAPSESEPVFFDGAGSQGKVDTRVRSHDAGILRRRPSVQLKVQTPADTNAGDSGAALIDADDRIVGFGFERTGIGEYPEFTDWIWADNALSAMGLTPI